MVKGKTRGDINVRNTPIVTSPITNLAFVSRGSVEFIGEVVTSALDNKQWIMLSSINGVAVTKSFIASWVVDITDPNYIPPVNPDILLTHTIEVYSDGSIKIDGIPYS